MFGSEKLTTYPEETATPCEQSKKSDFREQMKPLPVSIFTCYHPYVLRNPAGVKGGGHDTWVPGMQDIKNTLYFVTGYYYIGCGELLSKTQKTTLLVRHWPTENKKKESTFFSR